MVTIDEIKALRDEGKTWREIGEVLAERFGGIPSLWQDKARKRYQRYRRKTNLSSGMKASEISTPFEVYQDADLDDERTLLRMHGYDPESWEVVDSSCTIREKSLTTRVKVRPRHTPLFENEGLIYFITEALGRPPLREFTTPQSGGDLAVVAMFDVHFGRRHKGRNHDHTARTLLESVDNIKKDLIESGPKEILLPVGQDFFNFDTPSGTTTRGTPQTNSMDWQEMFGEGLVLMVEIIDSLSEVAPVNVVYSKGNHDEVLSFTMVKALDERYRQSELVDVWDTGDQRQYMRYGETLIGLVHGNEENNLSTIMQSEQKDLWGKTSYRYWLTGHLHHLEMKEKDGVTIIRCPSIAFKDEWTTRKGYVHARPNMVGLIFSSETGLKEIFFANPQS